MKSDTRTELFAWAHPSQLSEPDRSNLLDDLTSAKLAITVRSTAALNAMVNDLPVIWITPAAFGEFLKNQPLRRQGLAVVEVTTSEQLCEATARLLRDEAEYRRVVDEQRARLRSGGFLNDHLTLTTEALRRHAGLSALHG
jgi:hypothetical protein